jgi:hypothetical protein
MKHLIDHLESDTNWDKFFGIVDSLYLDEGFSTNADNFARVVALEKALAASSDLIRVDRKGYDFLYGGEKVELKVGKNLFFKKRPDTTKFFKVKSFLSSTKTVLDFQEESTFDHLMVIDLTARRIVIVEDEVARSLYQDGADGAVMQLKKGHYYQCDIKPVSPLSSTVKLSDEINSAVDRYIESF